MLSFVWKWRGVLDIKLLFSGPTLEKLVIDECNWVNLPAVIISAPKLQSLTIREMHDISSDSDSEYSDSDSGGCQVMIYGTGLRIFNYSGELLNDYRLYNSSTLVKASIDVPSCCKKSREAAMSVYKLLRGLSNVKDLKLSTDSVEVLTYAAQLLANLPVFNDLTSLVLGPKQVDFSCTALQNKLQNSPSLETLLLTEGISQSYKFGRILNPMPPCFLSHLKRIEVRDFYGNGEELYVVQILLENSTVLDTMVIHFASGLEERKEVEVLLSLLSRESKSCKLILI